ncbi:MULTISPECIES: cytochrome c oxidase subunit 4 [unclassified Streptomyces]|uniref:aa3-type cytochrome oxidase subunit IV n=1 Tax=unclassified Streptomyces TaxID=2593676 RepID=UPI00344F8953
MKAESYLFGGVAVFFLATGVGYGWWSGREPAGTAALTVAFIMSSLICFLFAHNYQRRGTRPEDNDGGKIADRAGPVDFFPARSPYPVLTATGASVAALGIVYGLWLFILGFGVLAAGVGGLTFQYVHRGE